MSPRLLDAILVALDEQEERLGAAITNDQIEDICRARRAICEMRHFEETESFTHYRDPAVRAMYGVSELP